MMSGGKIEFNGLTDKNIVGMIKAGRHVLIKGGDSKIGMSTRANITCLGF
jgi:hypothetical protein